MSNLSSQQINSSFPNLLQIPGGIKSYLQTVQDGYGNPTALQISTTSTNVVSNPSTITPEQFGAVGNGVADDTIPMQTALNYMTNGVLQLRSGATYLCGSLTVSNSTSINGSNSTIKAKGVLNTLVLYNAGCNNFFVNGVTFNGNNVAKYLLDFVTAQYAVIQNSNFLSYINWGIGLQSCSNVLVNNNYIKRDSASSVGVNEGIWIGTNITNSQYVTISNNTLINGGLLSSATDGHSISYYNYINNHVSGWKYGGGFGMGADTGSGSSASFVNISGNYCSSGTGIDSDNLSLKGIECFAGYAKISNNTLFGNSGPGIFASGYNQVISNNLCLNNGTYGEANVGGITIGAAANSVSVTGNKCSDTAGASGTQKYGISINSSATQINISANHLVNNSVGNLYAPGYSNGVSFSGRQYYASVVWDPASIANGSSASTTISIGSSLGKTVTASCSNPLLGLSLTAYVSATNQVTILLQNNTGAAVDLASSTFTVCVSDTIFNSA